MAQPCSSSERTTQRRTLGDRRSIEPFYTFVTAAPARSKYDRATHSCLAVLRQHNAIVCMPHRIDVVAPRTRRASYRASYIDGCHTHRDTRRVSGYLHCGLAQWGIEKGCPYRYGKLSSQTPRYESVFQTIDPVERRGLFASVKTPFAFSQKAARWIYVFNKGFV